MTNEETVHLGELPDSWGRFASLMLPEVAVRIAHEGWRVQKTTDTPYVGMCKARLGRSQYAVGDALEDGAFDPTWQWDIDEDDIGDDEAVTTIDRTVSP